MIKPGWMGLKGECYELDAEKDSLSPPTPSNVIILTLLNRHPSGVWAKLVEKENDVLMEEVVAIMLLSTESV